MRPPGVLRKVLFTLLTGGATYLVTNLSQGNSIWSVTLTILTGGVALIVQFLVDFERRLGDVESHQAAHTRQVENLLEEKFATINEATELFGLIEESAFQADVVTQLVRHATQISPSSPTLVYNFAQTELSRMSEFLKELSEGGEVTYDGEDRDWLLGLTRSARMRIDATSLTTVDAGDGLGQGGLWATDLGKRYLDAQGEVAREHAVEIRRLFILDRYSQDDSDERQDLLQLCRRHEAVGIKVRYLKPADLPPQMETALFDFVLFDNVISYEVSTGSWARESVAPIIVNTRLVLHPQRVQNRIAAFQRLWNAGTDPRGVTVDPLEG